MDDGAPAKKLPTAMSVLLWLVVAGVIYLVLGAFGLGVYFLVGGDPSGYRVVTVHNDCAVEVRVTTEGPSGVRSLTQYEQHVAPGVTGEIDGYADSFYVGALGGSWDAIDLEGITELTLSGAMCPVVDGALDRTVVAVRTPLLAGSDVIAVDSEPAMSGSFAPHNSDVTTITTRVDPEVAQGWVVDYGMGPATAMVPGVQPKLDDASAGALWVMSADFNQAVVPDELRAVAYLDPVSGTVVVQVRDSDPAL